MISNFEHLHTKSFQYCSQIDQYMQNCAIKFGVVNIAYIAHYLLSDGGHNAQSFEQQSSTRSKSLLKMMRIVENERFTVEIDSENAILDCRI